MDEQVDVTKQTYEDKAEEFSEYFKGIGSRADAVERVFNILGKSNPYVVELGCGDGRDAKEITKRTTKYLGIDYAESFVRLAEAHVTDAEFRVQDMTEFSFPKDIDAIFAFASVLHLDKDQLKKLLLDASSSLVKGGVFYISTKRAEDYREQHQTDSFGERLFYYYSVENIRNLAGSSYEMIYEKQKTIGNTDWLNVALRKM